MTKKWIAALYVKETIYKTIIIHHSTDNTFFSGLFLGHLSNDADAIFSIIPTYHV